MRLIWVYQFNGTEQFMFNDQFMINTNDGYAWAEGTRDLVKNLHQKYDLSRVNASISELTALIVVVLPFSFETIIFYMPAFFSSLLVIPIILIGKSIFKIEVGFIAALLASISWSYYNRTMVGYYDTDFLNIVFPTFLLWSLILAIRTQEDKYLIFTAFDIIAYRWWYPQSYALELSFFGLIMIYVIHQYLKKQNFQYNIFLLSFMMFSMLQIDSLIRFIIVISLFILLKLKEQLFVKYLYYIFFFSIFLFIFTGGFDPIWYKLKGYVFKDFVSTLGNNLVLHFFTVMQTVREAGQISFETFANRISGHIITFIISIIGYVWLSFKHKNLLLGLPMIGLGFLALSGGLRFTIYAIPVLSLGIAFLIYEVSKFLAIQFFDIKVAMMRYFFMMIFTIIILIPNIRHIINYKVPTVFTKEEVKVLDKLKKIANREDYVVGWWDYGYPIRYYADVKTLTDGAKHKGYVNFPTSFILTHSQVEASKMLRLDVEYTENRFKLIETKFEPSNIGQMTLDYGYKNTNNFLISLQTDINLPKKTRDVYLYLPNRMMNIYPIVNLFSNIDLMTGVKGKQPFFYKSTTFREDKDFINLGNNVKIKKRTGELIIGKNKVALKRFVQTVYTQNGKLQTEIQNLHLSANLNVIFMKNYKQFLLVDDNVYNSTYFQLFVLENYNKDLFEPIILTPLVKVYKLKI